MEKRFRRNVAIVVVNGTGRILACHRSDMEGAWQFPQGGIDEGETPEQAMWRELKEEIGTDDVQLLGSLPKPIRYDWPASLYHRGFHGQEQYYFLVKLRDEAKIDFLTHGSEKAEFDRYEWISCAEFLSRLNGFKADAYRSALSQLQLQFPDHFER